MEENKIESGIKFPDSESAIKEAHERAFKSTEAREVLEIPYFERGFIDCYNWLRSEVLRLNETKGAKTKEGKIQLIIASCNGALDGLELDNECDVIEKSTVIGQIKLILEIATGKVQQK